MKHSVFVHSLTGSHIRGVKEPPAAPGPPVADPRCTYQLDLREWCCTSWFSGRCCDLHLFQVTPPMFLITIFCLVQRFMVPRGSPSEYKMMAINHLTFIYHPPHQSFQQFSIRASLCWVFCADLNSQHCVSLQWLAVSSGSCSQPFSHVLFIQWITNRPAFYLITVCD